MPPVHEPSPAPGSHGGPGPGACLQPGCGTGVIRLNTEPAPLRWVRGLMKSARGPDRGSQPGGVGVNATLCCFVSLVNSIQTLGFEELYRPRRREEAQRHLMLGSKHRHGGPFSNSARHAQPVICTANILHPSLLHPLDGSLLWGPPQASPFSPMSWHLSISALNLLGRGVGGRGEADPEGPFSLEQDSDTSRCSDERRFWML